MSERGFKRKDPRFPTDLESLVRLVGRFEWRPAVVINLSQGGVCIKTKAEFEIGNLVEMEIKTIDKESKPRKRKVRGEIAWVRRGQFGIKFIVPEKAPKPPKAK